MVRAELLGFLDAAGADTATTLAGLFSDYDEILLHGQYACANDQVDKALRSFKECTRLRPDAFLPRSALGRILMGQGLFIKAEKYLRKAAEINPDDFKTKVTWLYLLRKTKSDPLLASTLQRQIDNAVIDMSRRLGYSDSLDLRMVQIGQGAQLWGGVWNEGHRQQFSEGKYTVLHKLLPEDFLQLLLLDQRAALTGGQMRPQLQWQRYATTDLPLPTLANYQLAELVAGIIGKSVIPTYAFSIHYLPGGNMDAHKDRMQNELSMSFNLTCTPPGNFPSLLAGLDANQLREIYLRSNSALLYRGAEVIHARCPVPEGYRVDQTIFGFRTINARHCYCI